MSFIKKFAVVALLGAVCAAAMAADVVRIGPTANSPAVLVDTSTTANTNTAAVFATNGYYPRSILAASTVTNWIAIPIVGNNLALQFTAASLGGGSTAVLNLYASVKPPQLGYVSTAGAYGAGGYTNAVRCAPFATITLVTADSVATTTNVNFGPAATATPAAGWLGGLSYLYIHSITAGSTYDLTNYSVWVNQR